MREWCNMGPIRAVRRGTGKSCSVHPLPYFSLSSYSLVLFFNYYGFRLVFSVNKGRGDVIEN